MVNRENLSDAGRKSTDTRICRFASAVDFKRWRAGITNALILRGRVNRSDVAHDNGPNPFWKGVPTGLPPTFLVKFNVLFTALYN